MQLLVACFRMQSFARFAIGEQLGDLGQDFEVLLRGLLGYEQEDQERNGLAVRGFEWNRLLQAHEGGERLLEAFDPAVRNGDTFAETCRAEAFANRLSVTALRAIPFWFSKISPACSNTRFLLVTDSSMTTFSRGRNLAKRFMLAG